jgi:hypothetical protein
VPREVEDGLVSPADGTRKLGLSARQFRRIRYRAQREGEAQGTGPRAGSRAHVSRLWPYAPRRAPLEGSINRPRCFGHLEAMNDRGQSLVSFREKAPSPTPRKRHTVCKELVQMDTSIHDWFEGRCIEQPVLIAMIDDITSRLFDQFSLTDSSRTNREVIATYFKRFSRMEAIYADRAGHFQSEARRRAINDEPPMPSVIKRGLESLAIELILALSPQAKGRVERLFSALQNQVLKEMRLAGISTLDNASRFLEKTFIPFWNERFAVEPQLPQDFHRPLPKGIDLMETFADTRQRLIRPDFTVRYQNNFYQIPKTEPKASMPRTRITVPRPLDGALSLYWKSTLLELIALSGLFTKLPSKSTTAELDISISINQETFLFQRDNIK